jgi:hypothetical protein
MNRIDVKKAKGIAAEKGLQPGRVLSSGGVQFTRGDDTRIQVIDWEEFETELEEKDLAIFESAGFMKIMKKKEGQDRK